MDMAEYTIEDFADPNVANGINRFTYNYDIFVCSKEVCQAFNHLLDARFRKVFVRNSFLHELKGIFAKQKMIRLDGEDVFFLTKKGHLLQLWNSEWGGIDRMV